MRRDAAKALLVAALQQADRREEVVMPVGTVEPRVSKESVEEAAARARALLAEKVEVDADGTRVALEPVGLAATLGTKIVGDRLDLTIDTDKLKFALGPKLARLEVAPVAATFAVNSSTSVSVVPSRDGKVLDYDAIAADILAGDRLVTAHLRDEHPEHDTEWAQKLGIKREVSSFTTKHPAGQPRVTNIHLAADALNNAIVEPGQTFSFNDYIGRRTPEKGYVKAPILVQDGFGEDYGGGVSQLVTTLYNAVFFGGYEDVEHSPHRFYISRYPMGREATINFPSVDLKFKNDTKYGVLIRVGYSSTSVTVTFFGDNEGRVVREENRKILKETPITDELIECPVTDPEDDPQNDCATLSAAEREQVTAGEPGFEVEFDRVIEQPGQPTKRRHYYKNYPMLPNKVLIGTAPPSTTTPATAAPTTVKKPAKSTTTTTRKH
jgi:vancomycin resistance protein YoaR